MADLFSVAQSIGLGGIDAFALSGRFSAAAQKIREQAEMLAHQAEDHGWTFGHTSHGLAASGISSWQGLAAQNYEKELTGFSQNSAEISAGLKETATLLRQAGAEMANRLDDLASNLIDLGTGINQIIEGLIHAHEKIEDIIKNVPDSPLPGYQEQLARLQNHELLRFAEAL